MSDHVTVNLVDSPGSVDRWRRGGSGAAHREKLKKRIEAPGTLRETRPDNGLGLFQDETLDIRGADRLPGGVLSKDLTILGHYACRFAHSDEATGSSPFS